MLLPPFLHFTLFVGYAYRVINQIFAEVDDHIDKDTLITDLKMSALPSLYHQFVRLIKLLVNFNYRAFLIFAIVVVIDPLLSFLIIQQMDNKHEDRGQVIILFQDMLEVVTRDIMEEQFSG